jgi:glycine/D-amino acid oxidase-like deaminating enzyme
MSIPRDCDVAVVGAGLAGLTAAHDLVAAGVDRNECPTLLCDAQDDPLSSRATAVYDGLLAPKTLLQFTSADGAGDHCEMRNRALLNLRAFSWLDETLSASRRQPAGARR